MRLPSHLPLFWTICLINGAVFVVGATVLLLSPARVSADPVPSPRSAVREMPGRWPPRRPSGTGSPRSCTTRSGRA